MELKLASSDNRRDLYELGEGGTWKVCKILKIKEQCILGNHRHINKDELFILTEGPGMVAIMDGDVWPVSRMIPLYVPRGTFHEFHLEPGSTLLCLASELHDPNDDHK